MTVGADDRAGRGGPARFVVEGNFRGAVSWRPQDTDEPAAVAAAFVQQQLVAAVRRSVRRDVSAAEVARAVGRQPDDRTVADVWAGRRAIALPMLLDIALVFGVSPLPTSDDPGTTLSLLFPPPYGGMLSGWVPGEGRPMFRRPGVPSEPDWDQVAEHVAARWGDQVRDGVSHLVRASVIAYAVVDGLAAAGVPPALASIIEGDRVRYDTASPFEVLAVHLGDAGAPPGVTSSRPWQGW